MLTLLWLTSLAASIVSIRLALLIRAELAAWTVFQSWNWMIAALLTVLAHAIVSLPILDISPAITSGAAYFAVTMLLTPLVTTLGARRPGIAPWHWFVVLPMVAVLQWPAVSQLTGSHWRSPLALSGPAAMGVIVVLIMSAGTMLGTSSAAVALLYSCGILLLLAPVISAAAQTSIGAGGSMLILAAMMLARRNLKRSHRQLHSARTVVERVSAVWELFRSLYGIAWTRRVQDRVNQFGPAEKWTVRLTATGFESLDKGASIDEDLQQPMNAFVWVLARFSDRTWLQAALNPQNRKDPTSRLN